MEDYPRPPVEFKERFATEEACYQYLATLRWPEGFVCPECLHNEAWQTKTGLYKCRKCKWRTSVTAGTIFHDSRKPMRLRSEAMWHIISRKYGANASGLQRVLSPGSYNTAWRWLHRLRRAMVGPCREMLSGIVEADETCIGGERHGKRGRGAENKASVAIGVEDISRDSDSKGIGRIRLKRIPDASAESLIGFISGNVVPGSLIRTDGRSGYEPLRKVGYEHIVVGAKELNIAHPVASLLKRWLSGTYQGAVNPVHSDYYSDEYTFRFNRRTSACRGRLFYRLVQQAVIIKPVHGRDIVACTSAEKYNSCGIHDLPF